MTIFTRYGIRWKSDTSGKIYWVAIGKGVTEDISEAHLWTSQKAVQKGFDLHGYKHLMKAGGGRYSILKNEAEIVPFEVTLKE